MKLIVLMCMLSRMIGRTKFLFQRLGWRHLIWICLLAGITYVCPPFFYAASYSWHLLHPVCQERIIENIQGEWIAVEGISAGFWYVPADNGRVIILVGGRGGTVLDWQPEVDTLVERGYGVAVLADPGCNLPVSSLGIREKEQVTDVVSYLVDVEQVEWIGAAGFSAGASALALAVPEMDELEAVVLMGNFADLKSEIAFTPYKTGSVGWLGQHSVPFWYWVYTGYQIRDVSPITSYDTYTDINVFLIQGEFESNRTRAAEQLEVLLKNDAVNAQLWIVPGGYHGTYYRAAGEAYLKRLVVFFDRASE